MRRAGIVVALVVVALMGIGGGSFLAITMQGRQADTLTGGSTPSPGGSSAGSSRVGDVFYFADDKPTQDGRAHGRGTIHDGERKVEVELTEAWPVSSLERLGDGWFTAQLQSEGGEQENYHGTVVYADGSTWDLGMLGLAWDIDSDGRVLYSPEPGEWLRADPAARDTVAIEVGGSGDRPEAMKGEPEWWVQQAEGAVLTGWSPANSTSAQLILTDPKQGSDTPVGPPGASRPNVAPDGQSVVAGSADEQAEEPACLIGGVLTEEDWWENCDYRRVSLASPYSPNSQRLLVSAMETSGSGLSGLAVLDAESGDPTYQIENPKGTVVDATWLDDRTLTMMARPSADDTTQAILYRVGIDGTVERIAKIEAGVTLGSA